MSQFPRTEAEIIALAHAIMTGLKAHPDEFPTPPLKPDDIQAIINDCLAASDEVISSQTRTATLIGQKKELFAKLTDGMRHIIQYAEHATSKENLPLIGWSVRAEPSTTQAPGQIRNFIYTEKGADWITLKWQAPLEGGKAVAYHVQSREAAENTWKVVITVFEKEVTLNNLPTGKNLEFRIEAANKQGTGPMSNTISVIF